MAIKSRQGCQNCKLRVHGNVFEQNSFFEKITYFYHFQTMSKNISEIGQKNSAEMSELHFTSPEETFDNCLLKKSRLNSCLSNNPICKKSPTLAEIFLQAWEKCNLGDQWNILGKNFIFRTLSKKLWDFRLKLSSRLSKLHLTSPAELF